MCALWATRSARVAACDQETAEKAARLVEVEYEELSFSIGFDDTLAGKNCLDGETPVRDEYELDVGEKQGSAEGLIEVCSTMGAAAPAPRHDGDTRLHCRL